MRLSLDGFTVAEILEYVLAGLLSQQAAIGAKILYLREQMASPVKERGRSTAAADAIKPKRGRPAKVAKAPNAKAAKPGKRELSPEARQRIADAQHRRWAAAKKQTRKRAPKVKSVTPEAPVSVPVEPVIEEMALAEVS